ncbi:MULTISPECIES: hypothetical protein [Klebsiella/Raoultella group]|jgi:hypothetical protein|uniref:hypothetical protein n=1 Tax=Klebsiella/Raoultella group TaxID=2890311 RepID=UPI00062C2FAA|nr:MULTISPECIES: hypothetical protein [Klebsiella/Raoultella group]EKU8622591.1 hypothetical protein [Klebsiella variicola]KKY90416.1 hypothetical protein OA43_00915 [Klebsiella variicola]MBA0065242.1 hypothetical protein [Klebsiella pneumoniae]MCP6766219.1 hypothetical protein [Klebsiella pneumoniae]MCR1576249.1 hypothetical protein [Klebsiella aerogenes]
MTESIHSDYFKWWCGTVVVGAIPIFIRLIAYFLTDNNLELFNITELVGFGFAIQISSIYFGIGQQNIKTENILIINTTFSLVFVVIFSIIYIISLISANTLNPATTKTFVIIACLISLYVGQNSVKCAIMNKNCVEG